VFDIAYEAMLSTVARRDRLDAAIIAMATTSEFTPVVTRLGCLRGVSTLTAFGLAVEIGDWHRLTGRTIGAYLGLVPTESSSGGSRSQGSITKTGNSHARRLLIEAAWHHRKPYRVVPETMYKPVDLPLLGQPTTCMIRRWPDWTTTEHTDVPVPATPTARRRGTDRPAPQHLRAHRAEPGPRRAVAARAWSTPHVRHAAAVTSAMRYAPVHGLQLTGRQGRKQQATFTGLVSATHRACYRLLSSGRTTCPPS
jgi:Transposase IS116/IS110/IS902 family